MSKKASILNPLAYPCSVFPFDVHKAPKDTGHLALSNYNTYILMQLACIRKRTDTNGEYIQVPWVGWSIPTHVHWHCMQISYKMLAL